MNRPMPPRRAGLPDPYVHPLPLSRCAYGAAQARREAITYGNRHDNHKDRIP